MKIKDLLKDYLCENNDVLVQFEIYQFDDILESWEVSLQETYKLSELLDDTVKNSLIRSEAREILDSNVLDYFSKDSSVDLTICTNGNFEYLGKEVSGIKITKYDDKKRARINRTLFCFQATSSSLEGKRKF